MDVIVIGAGIGGLAIARVLLAAGHRVRVYGQAPERRTGGKALLAWSNGNAILDDLGISLAGVGARIDRIDALTPRGSCAPPWTSRTPPPATASRPGPSRAPPARPAGRRAALRRRPLRHGLPRRTPQR
ncbi:NAD(P)-binding protein [Nonomuraea sp. N2-4H]|uniref:FAD-dependent oxidoreductase n=1 Tax=Nonomuraea sp. N2-4H TaxID=3128898 RepID=UPI0032467E1D